VHNCWASVMRVYIVYFRGSWLGVRSQAAVAAACNLGHSTQGSLATLVSGMQYLSIVLQLTFRRFTLYATATIAIAGFTTSWAHCNHSCTVGQCSALARGTRTAER
jgi:hypothetical protein